MAARCSVCWVVLLAWALASVALGSETWYAVQDELSAEGVEQREGGGARQAAEIEVAPGVKVRADIWADDYVPTYEDLVGVGFLPEDAGNIVSENVTWGKLKICLSMPDPAKCLSDKNEG